MKYQLPISVVMPCYNSGEYVSAAIQSILKQTFADFELIIIDDGSCDNSVFEISNHADDRIRFYSLKENMGNYFVRNMGIRLAKGKYVCVMDADDLASPDRLKIQYDYLNTFSHVGAIGSQAELMDENGNLLNITFSRRVVSTAQLKILLLMDNYILHPSLNNLLSYRVHSKQISTKHRISQLQYADQIRLERLEAFKIPLSKDEKQLYCVLMKRLKLSSVKELEKGISLCNKLLSGNLKLKMYNHRLLFEFFDYTLSLAKEKLSLR